MTGFLLVVMVLDAPTKDPVFSFNILLFICPYVTINSPVRGVLKGDFMKYNVIIVLDESRDKSYYYSYVTENGNIECAELPPYADPNKAQACYWDGEKWVFDADKYDEIMTIQAAEKEAADKAAAEEAATPTNAELASAVMELADNDGTIMDALSELANEIAALKGGE